MGKLNLSPKANQAAASIFSKEGLAKLAKAGGAKAGAGALSLTGKTLKLGGAALGVYVGGKFILNDDAEQAVADAFESPQAFFEALGGLTETAADGATKLGREAAQTAADTRWEGKLAYWENIVTFIDAIGGHSGGVLMTIMNLLRGQQTGKGDLAVNNGKLVELGTEEQIANYGADGKVGNLKTGDFINKFGAAGAGLDANGVLDGLTDLTSEFGDEAAAIKASSELMNAFEAVVIVPGGDVAANTADFYNVVKTDGLQAALGLDKRTHG